MRRRAHGFSLVELLVVISIMGILMAIIIPAVAGAQRSAREVQERKQLTDVNMGWKSWAASHSNRYPVPGLARRQARDLDGDGTPDTYVHGSGREDAKWNSHDSLLSLCIMENLIIPGQLLSPNEPSEAVYAYDSYRYNALGAADTSDPGATLKWDHGFSNDLLGENLGYCHNSYAIMPLVGDRRRDQWDRTSSASFVVAGTRGPLAGDQGLLNNQDASGDPQVPSNTAFLMGQAGLWRGILVYGDGHSDVAEGFYPNGATWKSVDTSGVAMQLPDNVFKADDPSNDDAWNSQTPELLGADILLTHTQSGNDNLWQSQSEINPYDIRFTVLHD
jgi:prepilin-type N-terminal cleavage/methylation domain-containing protein